MFKRYSISKETGGYVYNMLKKEDTFIFYEKEYNKGQLLSSSISTLVGLSGTHDQIYGAMLENIRRNLIIFDFKK